MRVEPLELELAYDLIDLVDAATGRRPARPGAGAAPQARPRARHRHPARAHPRQPRPAAAHLRHPRARRRGRPGRGARPGTVLAIGDDLRLAAGHAHHASRCSAWPPSGCRSSCASRPSWPAPPSSTASSVITTHLAEVVRTPRRPAARPRGRQAARRHGQGHRTRSVVEELTPAPSRPGRDPAGACSRCSTRGVASATSCASSRPCRERARATNDPEASSRPPAAPSAPPSPPPTPSTGGCRCSPSTRCSSRRCSSRCAPATAAASSPSTRSYAERLALEAARVAEQAEQRGDHPVLVCAQPLRPAVRRLVEPAAPRLPVLSYAELGGQLSIIPSEW